MKSEYPPQFSYLRNTHNFRANIKCMEWVAMDVDKMRVLLLLLLSLLLWHQLLFFSSSLHMFGTRPKIHILLFTSRALKWLVVCIAFDVKPQEDIKRVNTHYMRTQHTVRLQYVCVRLSSTSCCCCFFFAFAIALPYSLLAFVHSFNLIYIFIYYV